MEQLLVHVFGDYILQSDWMATNKTKRVMPCLVHVLLYTACFLILTTSWKALLVIAVTHFIIDHWHTPLKRLIWWKNHIGPTMKFPPYKYCDATGYFDDSLYTQRPPPSVEIEFGRPRHFFITMWLYIITDNFLHLTINYFALKYLGA